MAVNVDLSNVKVKYDIPHIVEKLKTKVKELQPSFISHNTDFKRINEIKKKYDKYENIVLIGNGGSITSFHAFHKAFAHRLRKRAFVVTTMQPEVISFVKENFPAKNTLLIAISKSGNTVGVIESLLALQENNEYACIAITSKQGTLWQITEEKKYLALEHPEIGGRFSGTSEVAYLPAALCGIDIKKVDEAAQKVYNKFYKIENIAAQTALALSSLEYNGFTELFMPIYSSQLDGFGNLIVQLLHESVCKLGRGQTVYFSSAPESQHHTNQRFFGGRRNVAGVFLRTKNSETEVKLKISNKLQKIQLNDATLKILQGEKLSKALEYEFSGVYQNTIRKNIPVIDVSVDTADEKNLGELIAFWQLVAVYSALLRDVDPFDQPAVEASKQISFELRKK
ncbi:TPA: hypothetical protein HA246_04090 [Candidatus Woesearchaeota archaeon]|nr:hypothetical protein [Candidatus Woesearchaeota archaeon]